MVRRFSQKAFEAAEVLSREEYGDCSRYDVMTAIERRRVAWESGYRLMTRIGYRWTGKAWLRAKLPAWLREVERGEAGDVV